VQVRLVLAPAAQTLGELVERGEAGTFDFAFIDADKVGPESGLPIFRTIGPPDWLRLLLRALPQSTEDGRDHRHRQHAVERQSGAVQPSSLPTVLCSPPDAPQVGSEDQSADTEALRRLNTKLAADSRVRTVMMNIGDGYTLATKL
jgi:predicted O-methyltransferase YrrM